MRRDWRRDSRGLSPVVGGALLIAIVVVLVSVTAVVILGATDETPPAPTSKFQIEQENGGHVLKLTAGERIDGDRITIQFVDDSGGSTVTSSDVAGPSVPQAKKAPTAAADVDDDFETELVYVGKAVGKLKYLDNIDGTIEIEYLTDEDGNRVDGSGETGTT